MKLNRLSGLYIEDLSQVANSFDLNSFNNKSFLITGATGMIGTFLIDVLMYWNKMGANIKVYAVGRSKEKAKDRFGDYYNSKNFIFIEQDVQQPLRIESKVDYIIPLASNTHPLAYSQYPIDTININVKGAEYALQKAFECNATILYPSTVEVYGNSRGKDIFTEDYTGLLDLSISRSCYTESKRVSEALCQSYIAEKKVKVKIVRLSRIFGPTMLMSDSKASSQFIIKALNDEDIILKSKGDQFFSYTYVADAVNAMLYVLLNGENGVAYNISNESCNVHLKDFALYCAEWAGKNVVFDLPSETEQKGFSIATQAVLDNTRLIKLGWKPIYDMKEALRRTLQILKTNY